MSHLRGLVFLLLFGLPARAEVTYASLFAGTGRHGGSFYELSLTSGVGGLLHAPGAAPIGLSGVRFIQHQGFISQLILLALGRLGVVLGAVDIQVESEYETYYNNGRQYRVEVARTTTVTQTKSEQQVQSELKELDEGIEGAVTWFEATVYAPRVFSFSPPFSSSTGYELAVGVSLELAKLDHLPVVLSLGAAGANVRSPLKWLENAGTATELEYALLALLARVHVPVTRFFDVGAEWQPNVHTLVQLGEDSRNTGIVAPSPLRFFAYLNLTNYLFARANLVLGGLGFSDGKLGYCFEVGGRL